MSFFISYKENYSNNPDAHKNKLLLEDCRNEWGFSRQEEKSLLRYSILRKITLGQVRKKYKEKYENLKAKKDNNAFYL